MLCVRRVGDGVMPGWRAGSGVGKNNAESPKQLNRTAKVQLYYEDNPHRPSRYIIYLWGHTIIYGAKHYSLHSTKRANYRRRHLPFLLRYSYSLGKMNQHFLEPTNEQTVLYLLSKYNILRISLIKQQQNFAKYGHI